MSTIGTAHMENGQEWGIGSWVMFNRTTWAQVIVPVEDLGSMSNEQIGEYVRLLIPHALLLNAQEVANRVMECGPSHTIEELEQERKIFSEAMTIDDITMEQWKIFDIALKRVEQKYRKLTLARTDGKRIRKEIQSNYNDIFVAIGRRDGFHCQQCGTTVQLQIDHIMPVSYGGGNDLDNLQLLCRPCNSSKSNSLPEQRHE